MNIVTKTILNCNYDHAKTLILRLCKKSHCTPSINDVWRNKTLVTFQTSSKRYKHLLQYRKCANFAINTDEDNSTSTKMYEHQLMHSILEESLYYTDTIMPPIKTKPHVTSEEIQMLDNMDWSSQSPLIVLNALKKLTYSHLCGLHFQNKTFDDILQACTKILSKLNNTEIQKLMQYLIVLNCFLKESKVYTIFIKSLSAECLKRFFSSNVSEVLLIADGFYQMGAWEVDYMWRGLRKIGSKPYKLSPKKLIQFLFFTSLCNVPDINLYEIQCRLEDCLPEINGNEIGVAARGFFLNQKKIHNKFLMEKIIKKVTNCCSLMDDVSLAAVMKLIRYSDCCHCLESLYGLMISLRTEVPKLPLVCLTHIIHTLGGQRIYEKVLMDMIIERMKTEIKSARIKDIERLIYTLCTVSPPTEYHNVCNEVVNEIIHTYKSSRSEEIHNFRKSLPRIIMFLTFKNIYPRELIEYALNPAHVTKMYTHNMQNLTNELFMIDCSVKIEMPDYTGPFLDNHLHRCLVKKFCRIASVPEKHKAIKLRTEVIFICKERLGLDVYTDWILPHYFNTDSVLAFDEHNNPVAAAPILSEMQFGSIKRVDSDDLRKIQWKLLFILTSIQKIVGYDGYIGHTYAKFRQLKAIGYTPIPIHEHQWYSLNTEDQKCNYLKQLIFQDSNSNFLKGEAF